MIETAINLRVSSLFEILRLRLRMTGLKVTS